MAQNKKETLKVRDYTHIKSLSGSDKKETGRIVDFDNRDHRHVLIRDPALSMPIVWSLNILENGTTIINCV